MNDVNRDNPIDLDTLLDTILKDRAGASPSAAAVSDVVPAAQNILPEEAGTADTEKAEDKLPKNGSPTSVEQFVELLKNEEKQAVETPENEGEPDPNSRFMEAFSADDLIEQEPDPDMMPSVVEKRRRFRRNNKIYQTTSYEEWADWGLQPIGHYQAAEPAEPPVPGTPAAPEDSPAPAQTLPVVDEFPPVRAVTETITMPIPIAEIARHDQATKVIPVIPRQAEIVRPEPEPVAPVVPAAAPVIPVDAEPMPTDTEQLPDQLSMEELVRVEDIGADGAGAEEDPEELLRQSREEKVRGFTFQEEEEELNDPEEEVVPPEQDEEIEDFTSYDETMAIRLELQYRYRTALLSLLLSGVVELALLVLTLLNTLPIPPIGYLSIHTFALLLLMILNYSTVRNGLAGLFSLRANVDTAPAVTAAVTLGGVLLHFLDMSKDMPIWTPLAGLVLVLSAVGRLTHVSRVRKNFAFVSYPGEKFSVQLMEDEKTLHEIGRRVAVDGNAKIAFFRKTAFLTDYLRNAYDEVAADRWTRWLTPLLLAAVVALSIVILLTGMISGFWEWKSAFIAMLCITTVSMGPATQLPMLRCCRRMLNRGGFIVGWKAVENYGDPDAVTVDVADLYPDESMLLHGIKTFSGMHIDDAILDAASLTIRAGGPLSLVFRRIIQNQDKLLREVDSLVYEQGMGLSGWVDGRRVLVGNRRLLENHGVDVPSADYEARYAKDGRRLVYLSTMGELSAMFVITYLPDESVALALRDICRSKVTLLVRTTDANITVDSLCSDFDLDDYYVEVLPAAAGRLYDELVESENHSAPAVMASNGHILGTAMALSSCRSAYLQSLIAFIVQTVTAVIGLALSLLWVTKGITAYFLPALLYMVVSAVLSWVIPLFRRA